MIAMMVALVMTMVMVKLLRVLMVMVAMVIAVVDDDTDRRGCSVSGDRSLLSLLGHEGQI